MTDFARACNIDTYLISMSYIDDNNAIYANTKNITVNMHIFELGIFI